MCIAYIKALPHCTNVRSVYAGTVSLSSSPLSIIYSVLSPSQALRSLCFALFEAREKGFCVSPFSFALYIMSRALPLLLRCLHLALFYLPPFSLALCTSLYSVSLPSPSLSILFYIRSLSSFCLALNTSLYSVTDSVFLPFCSLSILRFTLSLFLLLCSCVLIVYVYMKHSLGRFLGGKMFSPFPRLCVCWGDVKYSDYNDRSNGGGRCDSWILSVSLYARGLPPCFSILCSELSIQNEQEQWGKPTYYRPAQGFIDYQLIDWIIIED